MNKLVVSIILLLCLAVVAQAIWIWQFASISTSASLVIDASNAGVELDAEDGQVMLHSSGQGGSVVAQGPLGKTFRLDPGVYDVRVLFDKANDGQERWIRDLRLEAGQSFNRVVEFDSGEINVEASIDADSGEVVTYVFRRGNHDRVVTSMPSGEPVLVAPGVYDLRVVLVQNSEETDVHWQRDVPVKSGLQTRIRVPFRRGSLMLHAHNGDSILPQGAVELSVYRAGDADRELVASGFNESPLNLASGRYDVAARFIASHDKPETWLREVEIKEGLIQSEKVEFESGAIEISAKLQNGENLERYQTYAYFYPAGQHREPIAYVTPPDPAVLESGLYDVRVHFQRSHDGPDLWLRDLRLAPGERISKTVEFASGKLMLRAFDDAGNELFGDTVFVYVHARGARERPLAVARSSEIITLTAGSYDLRIENTVRPEESRWLAEIPVQSGKITNRSIEFSSAEN